MDQPTSSRPSRRAALACALAALATAGGGAAAGAQVAGPGPASGGTGYAAPAPAAGAALARPRVAGVVCRTACRGLSLATRGSVLRVEGDALGAVSRVVFVGGPGARDDVVAPATPAGAGAVDVAVPDRARDGRLAALTTDGRRSPASRARLRIASSGTATPRGPRVEARVASARVPAGGDRRPELTFFVAAGEPVDVTVDLVRGGGADAGVAHWTLPGVAGGSVEDVAWDGTVDGAPAPEGRYTFRLTASGPGGAGIRSARATDGPLVRSASFFLSRHAFPIAGPHRFGTGAAAFGGGRGHDGQDVFARCGTPLVAADGGRVRHRDFQGRAGNYLVVAGDDGRDAAYMHLRDPALVAEGERVAAGQPIGYVGQTGRVDGCHLHFELWTAPGWYAGGHPVDPLRALRSWDAG